MKKKVLAGISAAVLTIAIGTAVYATEFGPETFREMLPVMKEIHPNLNDSDLEQMYNDCHQQGRWDSQSTRMMHSSSTM